MDCAPAALALRVAPGSLSNLTLIYCGKTGLGQISRSFSLNRPAIRLKKSKNLSPTGLSLATIGQIRQAPGAIVSLRSARTHEGRSPLSKPARCRRFRRRKAGAWWFRAVARSVFQPERGHRHVRTENPSTRPGSAAIPVSEAIPCRKRRHRAGPFKTGAFNRSATSPDRSNCICIAYSLGVCC